MKTQQQLNQFLTRAELEARCLEAQQLIGILSLSAKPEPPDMKDGKPVPRVSYSATKHAIFVDDAIALRHKWEHEDSKNDDPDQCSRKTGAGLIHEERKRQVAQGFTAELDDRLALYDLGTAAACYEAHAETVVRLKQTPKGVPQPWPWGEVSWKPSTVIRCLVKAGALYKADAEKGDRAGDEKFAAESHEASKRCADRIDELQAKGHQ